MVRLRIPKIANKPKDFSKLPWTEEFRDKYPTHKIADYLTPDMNYDELKDLLFADKHVDFRKANLLVKSLKNEKGIVRNDNEVLLVVNFPFCEWRCVNCKRNMYQRAKNADAYMYYFDALMKEISLIREIIKKRCDIVKAICFTGNILALDEPELEKVLSLCSYSLSEINIELGNPKFITASKLDILKLHGVNRIIVNALTFNTVTLRQLCRRYEFKDVLKYYKLIAAYGIDLSIELCVGLLNEHELQLGRNIKLALELGASCIDLYSRHCQYTETNELTNQEAINAQRRMLEFANEELQSAGFEPYFLYCTEVDKGCFENVGYALPSKKCKFMEDKKMNISTVLGCGTDTITTVVKNLHNTRKSFENTPDIGQYIFGIDEILAKKRKFFDEISLQN